MQALVRQLGLDMNIIFVGYNHPDSMQVHLRGKWPLLKQNLTINFFQITIRTQLFL